MSVTLIFRNKEAILNIYKNELSNFNSRSYSVENLNILLPYILKLNRVEFLREIDLSKLNVNNAIIIAANSITEEVLLIISEYIDFPNNAKIYSNPRLSSEFLLKLYIDKKKDNREISDYELDEETEGELTKIYNNLNIRKTIQLDFILSNNLMDTDLKRYFKYAPALFAEKLKENPNLIKPEIIDHERFFNNFDLLLFLALDPKLISTALRFAIKFQIVDVIPLILEAGAHVYYPFTFTEDMDYSRLTPILEYSRGKTLSDLIGKESLEVEKLTDINTELINFIIVCKRLKIKITSWDIKFSNQFSQQFSGKVARDEKLQYALYENIEGIKSFKLVKDMFENGRNLEDFSFLLKKAWAMGLRSKFWKMAKGYETVTGLIKVLNKLIESKKQKEIKFKSKGTEFDNHKLGKYTITIPSSSYELLECSIALHNCINNGQYLDKIQNNYIGLVFLMKDTEYYACVTFNDNGILESRVLDNKNLDNRTLNKLSQLMFGTKASNVNKELDLF